MLFRSMLRCGLALVLVALSMSSPAAAEDEMDRAFARLYNFDFDGAHAVLNRHLAAHAADPLGYGVRAAVYLFWELNRLGILEGQFFIDDKQITEKKKLKLDPEVRRQFFQAIEDAQSRSQKVLATAPDDENALYALCMTHGMIVDYAALIEKRQIASLSLAKRSNGCAQKLLKLHPDAHDARITTGFTEYLVGSLPFFARWIVHFEEIKGSKEVGIQNLELVARSGHYLKPFAKILLAIVYLREKKPQEAERQLAELARDFPENPLIRKELARLSTRSPRDPPPATSARPSSPHPGLFLLLISDSSGWPPPPPTAAPGCRSRCARSGGPGRPAGRTEQRPTP